MRYAIREYACTAIDIIARRTRLAFCNANAAEEALPRIVQIMAEELKWNKSRQQVSQNHFTQLIELKVFFEAYMDIQATPI